MFSKTIIVGNLGGDPTMKYMNDGTAVTNFSVAVNRKWDGGEETAWFRVSAWGRTAENCHEYLHKGSQVLVEGRLKPDENGNPRTWQDNQGNTRASFEVTAQNVRFLGGGTKEEETSTNIPF